MALNTHILYTPAGGVQRDITSKLAEHVSVRDFGALGDGSTDDTDAVQEALNSGAKGVEFPEGTYLVDTVTVPNGVRRIHGCGLIKQRSIDQNVFYCSAVDGLTFEGLSITGVASLGAANARSSNSGIYVTGSTDVTVKNCRIDRMLFVPVYMESTYDSRIEGCMLLENALGPRLRGCRRVTITANIIRDTCLVSTEFTAGIGLDSTDGHALGICTDVLISQNVITGLANAQGVLVHAGGRITVSGNDISGAAMGISCNPYNATDALSSIVIDGNIIENYTGTWTFGSIGNDCIVVQGGGTCPDPTQIAITNNVCVHGNRSASGSNMGAIRIGYTSRVTVSGNVVVGAYGTAIYLTDSEDQIAITGNSITATVINSAGQHQGVYVSAGTEGLVTNNIIADSLNGVVFGGASNVIVDGNKYRAVTTYVLNAEHAREHTKTVTSGTTLDLGDVSTIYLSYASPTTISAFTNVIPGRLYVFQFADSNVTINRSNAYLDGSVNLTGTANDVVLMLGLSSNRLLQAGKLALNG